MWIRFNPDGGGAAVNFEDKLEVLRAEIEDAIVTIEAGLNEELVSIVKLFY